jgi:miniconductance mechanosensitive channel
MAYSLITGNSVSQLLTVLGAASAVLILVFKDTILGFVGSIQLSSHDMVKVGDWVSIENYDANGTVLEIGITAVKIQNFDRTITSVPTSALVSDSFINWKGMQESEGRRIKRSLFIKQSSIRFLKNDELERFKKIYPLGDYIEKVIEENTRHNKNLKIDQTILINRKNLTNFGLFRKYAQEYLKSLPVINTDMTLMARQLQSTDKGIPLEIYAFSRSKQWIQYEQVMADIFDHLIASVHFFDLEIFELPSGGDYKFYDSEIEKPPSGNKSKRKKKSDDLLF